MKENAKKGSFKLILISLTAVFLVASVIIMILLFNNNNKDKSSDNEEISTVAPLISQEESSEQESIREESKQNSKEISEGSKEVSQEVSQESKEEIESEDSKTESKNEESKDKFVTEESKNEERTENSKEESKREESSREESKEISKEESKENKTREDNFPSNSGAYEQVSIKDKIYYHRMDTSLWGGEFHKDKFDTSYGTETIMKVVDYNGYIETLKSVSRDIDYGQTSGIGTDENILVPAYTDESMNYLILSQSDTFSLCDLSLINVVRDGDKLVVYGHELDYLGNPYGGSGYLITIPTYMPAGTEIEYVQCYEDEEIENLKKFGSLHDPEKEELYVYKPVIYLYPTEETEVTVKLLKEDMLTCTYPKYDNEWKVIAKPNGDLVDLKTGRNLYSLYYESKNTVRFKVQNDGFVIKGEDSAAFLEEKLAILGLTEREAEEFIIYWLPILEANKYNYIRFSDIDEINENMPLEISSDPDSVIRVIMTFKGLDAPINVKEQKLTPAERTGFTVVEWGGTELK